MFDVTALGEGMVEFNQTRPGERAWLQGFGGDTSNAVIAAARAGAKAAYLSRVGGDEFGALLLDLWRAEGVDTRYARHARLNHKVRAWGFAKGFKLLPEERYGSISLNCFKNTLNLDLTVLNKLLKSKHALVIDGGYGKLKGKTFRISNMGDETDQTIDALLAALDDVLPQVPKSA